MDGFIQIDKNQLMKQNIIND